jgi:hypothetical protein
MDVRPDRPLREAEGCINRQQKIANELQARGHLREARQAREILALFVRSYLIMQDHRLTFEDDKIDRDPVAY